GLVPTTIWDEMASPPSLMSVQLAPRLPLARLKLSDADVAANARLGRTSRPAMSEHRSTTIPRENGRPTPKIFLCVLTDHPPDFGFPVALGYDETGAFCLTKSTSIASPLPRAPGYQSACTG